MKNRTGPPAAAASGAVEAIDQNRALVNRIERNAGVEVVGRGVQREIANGRLGADAGQQSFERDGVAFPPWVEPADVWHLVRRRHSRQVGEREHGGVFDVAVDREQRFHRGTELRIMVAAA